MAGLTYLVVRRARRSPQARRQGREASTCVPTRALTRRPVEEERRGPRVR
jgi:hypothetical protein